MQTHPLADWFPMLEGAEWASFVKDVKTSGVLHPVVIYKGQILDGRNRWFAASELGVQCPTAEFNGTDAEALAFVMSSNIKRRHLSTQERAEIAARMATMAHGGDRTSKVPDGTLTSDQAADAMNVSRRSVMRAKAKAKPAPKIRPSAAKPKDPPKAKIDGYKTLLVKYGLVTFDAIRRGRDRQPWVIKIAERLGVSVESISSRSQEMLARVEQACKELAEEAKPRDQQYAEHRRQVAEMPKSWQEKFERAVAKELGHMRANLEDEIRRAADAKIPERIAMLERKQAAAEKEERSYAIRRKGIAAQLSEADYRLLLNALHPDRKPDRDKLNRCFHIVRKLEPYIEAAKTA